MGSNVDGRLGLQDRSIHQTCSPCLVEALVPFKARDISCGWAHTLACTDQGQLFSWGLGEFGALGTGDTRTCWTPTEVSLPNK